MLVTWAVPRKNGGAAPPGLTGDWRDDTVKTTKNLPPLTAAQRANLARALDRGGKLPTSGPPKEVRPSSLLGRGMLKYVPRGGENRRSHFLLTPKGKRAARAQD